MNAIQKFWIGFFTFLPIIFVLIFFGFFFTVFLGNIEALENNHGEFSKEFMQSFAWFIMLIILTGNNWARNKNLLHCSH
jgi:magnesium-transporting ATPase (P-type)